jgi:exosortase
LENDPASTSGDASRASTQRVEIALIATLIVIWIPGILQLAEVWSSLEYASHGFLVPFVALWAATAHRVELARLESRPIAGGLVLMGLLACCYLAALLFRDSTLLGLVAVATVVASVLALRGVAWVSTLRFSLGYLLFMVPLPVAWVTPVIVKLQLLVSSVGVEFLQRGGIAIFREGNVLTLPGGRALFVAEACSGITSLITLLPIGVFIAYFTESISWRRLVLVGAVVPIALAGNLLRVILTVLLSIHVSVEFATQGPLHDWAGVATYVIGCACLLGVGALMRRFLPEDEPAQSD